MKKLLILALVTVLTLPLLIACTVSVDSEGGNSGESSPSQNLSDIDLDAVIGGIGRPSDYDAATRQAMIDAARAEGGDLEFKADGSMIYTDPDGSATIQNADGSWTYQDEDGSSSTVQFGGDWPENKYTKQLPKPDFGLYAAAENDSGFEVLFSNATLENIKEYVEQIKKAGFTVDAETEDTTVMGMVIFTYNAENAAGYKVSVYSTAGIAGLSIDAP